MPGRRRMSWDQMSRSQLAYSLAGCWAICGFLLGSCIQAIFYATTRAEIAILTVVALSFAGFIINETGGAISELRRRNRRDLK